MYYSEVNLTQTVCWSTWEYIEGFFFSFFFVDFDRWVMNNFVLLENSFFFWTWFSGQSNGAIWGSLFNQPSVEAQPFSLPARIKPPFRKETLLGWRLSNINTPLSPSTFHPSIWPSPSPCPFSLWFLFRFFSVHVSAALVSFSPPSASAVWRLASAFSV